MKKTYTFKQKLIAALCNENVEWHYASESDRLLMRFQLLSEIDKMTFKANINGK